LFEVSIFTFDIQVKFFDGSPIL